ncbi:MAG: hypothetical protein AAF598_10280 [Bacteroidota bacterium]
MITIGSLVLYIGIAAAILVAIFAFGLGKKPKDATDWVLFYLQEFVGALFIFSGLVKAVDPKGTAYKMEQYFAEFETAFASPLSAVFPFLAKGALAFSIGMVVIELVLGINLIFGIRRKLTAQVFLPIIIFFTILTGFTFLSGYSPSSMAFMLIVTALIGLGMAIYLTKNKTLRLVYGGLLLLVPGVLINLLMAEGYKFGFNFADWDYVKTDMKVTDCGCFGDFLKLEPRVSFIKDLVLLPPAIWFILASDSQQQIFSDKVSDYIMIGALVISTVFCFQNSLWNIPMVDFRPFAEGTKLMESRETERANVDEVERIYVYRNKQTDERVQIPAANLNSSTQNIWGSDDYEAMSDELIENVIKKGSDSKIKDFEISNLQTGEEITGELVDRPGYNFMVVAYDLSKANMKGFMKVNALAEAAEAEGMQTFVVTKFASETEVDEVRHAIQAAYPFHVADDILLKTIVRSNPGVILLKDGQVIKKWHHSKLPTFDKLKAQYMQ